MKRSYKYAVAVSAVDFDVLTAAELKRRLERRLRNSVFLRPRVKGKRTATATAGIRRAFERDARVIVVLHQQLWGAAGSTEIEAAAVKARAAANKRSIVVLSLDGAALPSWLRGAPLRRLADMTADAMVDFIVQAVVTAGGMARAETDAKLAERVAHDEKRARDRASFLTSQRALTLVSRELEALTQAVTRSCGEPGVLPDGVEPFVRRTPDRYTLQIGAVGLSFSWLRGRSNSIADGQLLIIEWDGLLAENQEVGVDTRAATPRFEHVLQPQATSPEDWQWRRSDGELCAYSTRDLANQCASAILRRVPRTAVGQRNSA